MKSRLVPQYLVVALLIGAASGVLCAQEEKAIKRVPAEPARSMKGDELFNMYCAVCHGINAKGNGPAAGALKKKPADLTLIARRHNGKFPELSILRVIKGDDVVGAHGSRDMPTWGPIFGAMSTDKEIAEARVLALMKYLEQIQVK